jgi:O-antigen ligase
MWWRDLNPSRFVTQSEEKKAHNLFDIAAAICFLFAAFVLPYKPQPALASLALCCVLSLLGSHWKSTFKNIISAPLACVALGLYAAVLLSYTYSSAPFGEKIKFISAYRELLFIPFLLCFLNGFNRLKKDAALIFFVFIMVVIGFSTANFLAHSFHLTPFLIAPPNDNYIFHSHIIQNVMSTLAVLFLLIHAKSNRIFSVKWWVFLTVAAIGIANILLMVQGRTGHMTLIACCFIFVLCTFNKKTKLFILFAIVAALLALLSTKNPFNDVVKRTTTEVQVYEKTREATSAGARIEFWKHAITRIKEKPLVGHGAGSFRSEYAAHIQKNNLPGFWPGTHHPHNEFLFLWHDSGLLALLLFVGLIAALLWQAHRTENTDTKTMRYGIAASFAIYAMVDVPMFNSAEALFFVLMIACFFELNMRRTQL